VDDTSYAHGKNSGRVVRLSTAAAKVLRSRIVGDAAGSTLLRATTTLLAFLTTVLLARLLGAESFGVYAFAHALVTVIGVPAHVGIPSLVMRETARGMAQNRPDLVKGVWRWAVRFTAVLSAVVTLVLGPVFVWLRGGLGDVSGITMAWALAMVPFMALASVCGGAVRGLRYVVAGQFPELIVRPALFLVVIGAVALLVPDILSAPFAMLVQAGAWLTALLLGAWMLARVAPRSVRGARAVAKTSTWLSSSFLFGLSAAFTIINKQVSTVVVGVFESPDQVGVFRVAVQVALLAAFGLHAVNQVVAPRFALAHAKGNLAYLQRLATASARLVLAFGVLIAGLVAVFGRSVFPVVFGAEFSSAFLPLLIMLAGQLVNSAVGPVGFLLKMTGHESETVRAMVLAAILNFCLSMILVPAHGILGAAVAAATSMAAWNVLLWWRARQVLGVNSFAFARMIPVSGERHGGS